jgi:hypothetical protein
LVGIIVLFAAPGGAIALRASAARRRLPPK